MHGMEGYSIIIIIVIKMVLLYLKGGDLVVNH